jgi:hypothetical protein
VSNEVGGPCCYFSGADERATSQQQPLTLKLEWSSSIARWIHAELQMELNIDVLRRGCNNIHSCSPFELLNCIVAERTCSNLRLCRSLINTLYQHNNGTTFK